MKLRRKIVYDLCKKLCTHMITPIIFSVMHVPIEKPPTKFHEQQKCTFWIKWNVWTTQNTAYLCMTHRLCMKFCSKRCGTFWGKEAKVICVSHPNGLDLCTVPIYLFCMAHRGWVLKNWNACCHISTLICINTYSCTVYWRMFFRCVKWRCFTPLVIHEPL